MWYKNKKENIEFKALINPYMTHINQLAFRFTGNKHDAEDLIQDVLLKIYPDYHLLQKQNGLKSWLSRVLYNAYIDQWRKNKNNPICTISNLNHFDQDDERFFNENICNNLCPEELTNLSQQQQMLTRLLFELKNEHRIVIIMHDVEGNTLPELSVILGVPLGTLKSRLHRARLKLKFLLIKDDVYQADVVA